MTNIDRVILLLADGAPRTPTQIARAMKIPKAQVINALANIRDAGRCAGKRQEFTYALTPEGKERVEQMRAEAAALSEQDEDRAAAAQASAKAKAAILAARSGAVPNSVFAWGQGSDA
jgi:DNA-binding PadR family transcriptional regulator